MYGTEGLCSYVPVVFTSYISNNYHVIHCYPRFHLIPFHNIVHYITLLIIIKEYFKFGTVHSFSFCSFLFPDSLAYLDHKMNKQNNFSVLDNCSSGTNNSF